MKKWNASWLKNCWVFYLTLFFVSVLSFSIVLIPRELPFLKTISVLTRYNTTRFLPITAILLFAALSIKNHRLSSIITALVLFPLFSMALNGLWAGAYSENYVIAGLIPRSDAFGFYGGAVALLEKGYQISIAKRRPLFGGFLAFILWVSGGNLQLALAVIVYLAAAVTYFSVLTVKNSINAPAAVVYFSVMFLFYRRFIGITMSENMGFLLGTSAFTLFMIVLKKFDQPSKKNQWIYLLAVFLFSFSQAARPGAVVTLPLFILFGGWVWRIKRKFAWKLMAFTTIAVIAGFMANTVIFKITSPANTSQISNIGYGVYGLAVGGKGWEQIFTDHPEVDLLETHLRSQRIIQIVIQEITTHPENLVKGLGTMGRILFSFQSTNSLYSFAYSSNTIFTIGLISIYFLLSAVGVVTAAVNWKKPMGSFILLLTLGFFGSMPLAPAYQTQYMRVYASSIFLLGLLPGYGFSSILKYLPEKINKWVFGDGAGQNDTLKPAASAFSIVLLFFIVGGPLLVKYLGPSKIPEAQGCPEGQREVILKYYPGSSIHIYKNAPDIMTWVPTITQLDYKGSIHNICCDAEILYFENIHVPNVLYPAVNLIEDKLMYMIVDQELLPDTGALLHVCGRIEDVYGEESDDGFLYPEALTVLEK